MINRYICIFTILLILFAQNVALCQVQNSASVKTPVSEERINETYENVTLADVLKDIGAKYKINIIADYYYDETKIQRFRLKNATRNQAIVAIASAFQRPIHTIDSISILRDPRSAMRLHQEQSYTRIYRKDFTRSGTVVVNSRIYDNNSLLDSNGFPVLFMDVNQQLAAINFELKSKGLKVVAPPADVIDVVADKAMFKKIIAEIKMQAHIPITVYNTIPDRRLCVQLFNVSPGQACHALAYIINSTQNIGFFQAPAQEAADIAMREDIDPVQKESDILREKLYENLTEQQKKDIADGKIVPVNINGMSKDSQELAKQFISDTLKQPSFNASGHEFDFSKLSSSQIVFLPFPSIQLGIVGFMKDGTQWHF